MTQRWMLENGDHLTGGQSHGIQLVSHNSLELHGQEDIPPIESEDEVSWDVEADVHIVKAKSSEVVLYHLRRLTTGITPFVTYR